MTGDQIRAALDTIEAWSVLLNIPGTSIDDVMRTGFLALKREVDAHPHLADTAAYFLSIVPRFGETLGAGQDELAAFNDEARQFLVMSRAAKCC